MGAIPVFAEIEGNSFNLNPEKLPAALAAGKKAGIDVVGIIGVFVHVGPFFEKHIPRR